MTQLNMDWPMKCYSMYKILPDRETIYFDVDDTLVVWDVWQGREDECLTFEKWKYNSNNVVPHYEHIAKLKQHKEEGDVIVVWTQGGSEWGEAVVKALNLENYVDIIMNKPDAYYDDLHVWQFMPEMLRTYIKPKKNGIT